MLARNALWNLLGAGAPTLAAVWSIPILTRVLGTERFGVLGLAWVFVGYFSLFDFGLARALTKQVAFLLGAGKEEEIPALAWTSMSLLLLLGVATAIVMTLLAPRMVHETVRIPKALQPEALSAFYFVSLSVPLVILSAGFRGFLEAHQKFGLINIVRIPLGVFTFVSPLLVFPFSTKLGPVLGILMVGRCLAALAMVLLCFRVMPALCLRTRLQRAAVRPLLRLGGWMTVSNVANPIMMYLDRFLIGALFSMSAVAYFVMPYEFVTKLLVVPAAVGGVLFPAFSACWAKDLTRTSALFRRGVRYIFFLLFPTILTVVTFAKQGLTLWLGADFGQHSTAVLQWMAFGVFMNALAQVPFAQVQGTGRADLTGKLHLIELPAYVFTLYWLVHSYGIVGAAIAWDLRVTADALVLFAMSSRLLTPVEAGSRQTGWIMFLSLPVLGLAALLVDSTAKGMFFLTALCTFVLAAWFLVLPQEERLFLQTRLRLAPVSQASPSRS